MSVSQTRAATYGGTGGTFLRTGGWAVLLDVRPDHPLVDLCWEQLGSAAELDDVLETVVAQGLRAVPAFAVVRETSARRVVARGLPALVLDGTDVLLERHAGAWVDLPLTHVSAVEVWLTGDGPTGPSLPLRDGAAEAAGFRLTLDGPATARGRQDTGHLLTDTLAARATEEPAGTGPAPDVSAVPAVSAVPTAPSEDTLPTTFTAGLAPTPSRRTGGRDRSVSRRPLTGGDDALEVPRVLAAVCPAGHLTPAYSGLCRVCRRMVATQEAFETARPALGRLVLPQGDPLLLDRGAVLGRAPYVPSGWAGAQPHLVALHDPDHDVSAQHLSVVLDLWNVLVCDLGSTNGTRLVDPAGRSTRLAPYEPVALGPGVAVVLADVVTLQFEVHP